MDGRFREEARRGAVEVPPDERSEAAEALLLSLEQEPEEDEAEVAAAWAAEIERRIDENAPGILAEDFAWCREPASRKRRLR